MPFSVRVEGVPEATFYLKNLKARLDESEEALSYVADTILLPQVYARSISVWNIRTGSYSAGWYRATTAPNTVVVANQTPYALPLETGWTTKGGGFRSSPGVLYPVFFDNLARIYEEIKNWVKMRIRSR